MAILLLAQACGGLLAPVAQEQDAAPREAGLEAEARVYVPAPAPAPSRDVRAREPEGLPEDCPPSCLPGMHQQR